MIIIITIIIIIIIASKLYLKAFIVRNFKKVATATTTTFIIRNCIAIKCSIEVVLIGRSQDFSKRYAQISESANVK